MAKSLISWSTGTHHQMHVDRRSYFVISQRLADHWSDRKVRHVVIVHDIEMNDIRARIQDCVDLFTESSKVGGQDGGSDQIVFHCLGLYYEVIESSILQTMSGLVLMGCRYD